MKRIYLDYNATTPLDPRVAHAMLECQREFPGNPSSQHRSGRRARQRLEEALDSMAAMLGMNFDVPGSQVILTSGGTEANNLAILGRCRRRPTGRMIVSALEHPSVLSAAAQLAADGWEIDTLRSLPSGVVDLGHLHELLAKGPTPALACVMLANHETGVLQPIRDIAGSCREHGVALHCDAVQAMGKIKVDVGELMAETLTVAAHKFHGPSGVGLLFVREPQRLSPILFGGQQQAARRPGTEPVALAVGMDLALRQWHEHAFEYRQALADARDRLQSLLTENLIDCCVNGTADRLPQTLNCSFLGLDRQALLMALDLAGVECATGSACASGSSEPSPVLQAMGLSADRVSSALRLSVGRPTSTADVQLAAARIINSVNDLRERKTAANSPWEPRERPVKRV